MTKIIFLVPFFWWAQFTKKIDSENAYLFCFLFFRRTEVYFGLKLLSEHYSSTNKKNVMS